jgi:hypothetical protein
VPGSTQVPDGRRSTFAYGTITLFGRLSHTFLLANRFLTPICQALQHPRSLLLGFGLLPFRSPLLRELSLFLWVLRCFSSPGSPLTIYVFNCEMLWSSIAGFPIRTSPDQSLYTAPRGFSQCPTSFFGTWRLGIHHKLLVAYSVMRRFRNSSFFFFFRVFFPFYSVGNVLPAPLPPGSGLFMQPVEMRGLEPLTSALQRRRSPS